jgi:hypothetical protein
MRSSKYPLEICGCTLPFWYSTLHQISEGTAPDLNLLTAARSQGRIDVVIKFFLFGGDVVGLSVAICYGASKSYAPTCNLATYHRILFVMPFCCDYASEQDFEPSCHFTDFFSPTSNEYRRPLCDETLSMEKIVR